MVESDHVDSTTDRVASLYRIVGLDPPGYRREDVARLTGIAHERSVKWWRAMGFPEVPEDIPAFADVDIQMLRRLGAVSDAGMVDDESILRLARLLGASFSRIAEAQMVAVEQIVADAALATTDMSDSERADAIAGALDESVLDMLEGSLIYVWRRHLLAALGQRLETEDTAAECAVGFADLCGFTKLSQRVSPHQLANLVDKFEEIAFDVVSSYGGRTIKLIGDEVMFVADSLPIAVDIGLDIADRVDTIRDLPAIHTGIASGPTVAVGGDVFGPPANLASRLTTIARPGTIVITRGAVAQLSERDDLEIRDVHHTFDLKGIGETRVAAVRRKV